MKRKIAHIKIALNLLVLCAVFSGFLFPDPAFAANAWNIRQEINITDGYFAAPANQVATSSGIIYFDPSKYSGTVTVYFEAVASTSASFTNTITLRRNGTGTDDCTISIPGGTTSYTLLRSSACTMPTTATEYVARISSSASGTTGVKAVRLIVLQSFADTASSAATSTQTQIEIGNEETYSNTSTSTFASPKYWTYDSTKWDGGTTFYAEVTYKTLQSVASSTLYSTAGSYTVVIPSGTASTSVQLWGGGGAGGPAATNPSGGDGGAGGQYASSTIYVSQGGSKTLVVAASTAGCTSGTCASGADSTWASTIVVAKGGAGGAQVSASTTGSTTGCVGDTCLAGGNGGKGTTTYGAGGGEGAGPDGAGNSATGAGVAGTGGSAGDGGAKNTASKTNGNSGNAPGGGGGGAFRAGNGGTVTGGAGAAGQALIINYIATTTIAVQEDDGNFGSWTDKAYILTGGGAATSTRYRSSAFTPVTGRHYRIAFRSGDGRTVHAIYNAKIIVDQGMAFTSQNQTSKTWNGIAVDSSDQNIYTTVSSDDIYKQTGGSGNFAALSQGALAWNGIAIDSSNHNAYATVNNGDIYKQTGGSGNFAALSQTPQSWSGIAIDSTNHDVYVVASGFDIYKQTGGSGNFAALSQGAKSWSGVAIDSSTHDVYAVASNDDIYKQTGGSGNFAALSQGALMWTEIAIDSSTHDVYAFTTSGDVYKQAGGTGNFALTAQLGKMPVSITIDSTTHDIYAVLAVDAAYDIYKNTGGINTFSKLEPQYLLANTKLSSGTSLQNFLTKWDSSEWTGTTATYLHAVDSANGSASVATLNTSAGTLLTGSTVTSPSNQSTSTSVTMPANGNLDMKATTNNNDIYASRILVQASQTVATTMTVSGTLYGTDESTAIATGPTVKLSINGGTAVSTTADGSGNFSFTGVSIPSTGDIVTIWISGATEKGTLVFRYGSSCTGYNDCTGLSIYRDEVIVDSKDGSALTNTNLASCDNDSGTGCTTTDIGFTSNSGTLTLASGRTLRIKDTSSVFSPGGNVTADKLKQSAGTVNGGTGTLTFGDFILSGGTFNSTSGTMNVNGLSTSLYTSWNHTGGTFNHNNGTVVRGNNSNTTWDFPTTETFYDFTANISGNSELVIASGDTMVVTHTLTHANGNLNGPGAIEVQGSMVVTGTTSAGGNASISFLVSGDQTITGGTGVQTASLLINKPAGSVSVSGDLSIADFTLQSGTFVAPSQTLYVRGKSTSLYTSWSHTGGTFSHNNGTVVRTSNSNTTWDFPTSETFYNFTNDISGSSELDIATGDTMIVAGTYTNTRGYVNGPGTLEVQGNIVISATAQGGTANVNLTGAAAQTLTNSGGTANTGMFSITKTNNSDTVTLATNFTFTKGLVVNKGTFSQGASYNFTTASTTYIGTNGTWNNTGTGDVILGGNVTNAGTITLNSSNGSQCFDATDDISITSSVGGTQRTWSGAGTFTLYNVAVTDMLGALTAYTSTFSNSNWTNGTCNISISGTVYTNEGVTAMGSGRTVSVKVNGSGTYTTTTAANGTYTVTGVPYAAADVLTIYLDGATEKAVTITRDVDSYASTLTGVDLYQNFVIVRDDSTTAITNANLGLYDSAGDPDINFTVSSGNLTVLNSNTLYVKSGTYNPGGAISGGKFKQVGGTFTAGSSLDAYDTFALTGGTYNASSATTTIGTTGMSTATVFSHTAGTFNHNNGIMQFSIAGGSLASAPTFTIDVPTSESFYNLVIDSGNYTNTGSLQAAATNITSGAGDTITAVNNLTHTNGILGGTWNVQGNVFVGSGADGGKGTISFTAAGAHTYASDSSGSTAQLAVNNASAVISAAAGTTDLNVNTFSLVAGSFTAPSGTMSLMRTAQTSSDTIFSVSSGTTFNHNNGTLSVITGGGTYGAFTEIIFTLDVPTTLNLNNVVISSAYNYNSADVIPTYVTTGSGDSIIVEGTFTHTSGDLSGLWEVRGNVVVDSSVVVYALGGTLNFTGSSPQTFSDISGGSNLSSTVIINKTNFSDVVTLGSNVFLSDGLVVNKGTFSQGASYNFTTASTTYIGTNGTWNNTGTGDVILGGNVTNAGTITLNSSNGSQCFDATDDISITSSVGGTQRTWSGAGTFTLYNVAVTDMLGALTAYNSTFSNSNWTNGVAGGCAVSRGGGIGGIDGGDGGGNQVTGGTSGGGATNGGGSGGGSQNTGGTSGGGAGGAAP